MQQKKLHKLLQKMKAFFDGTLGTCITDILVFELDDNEKPI